MSNETILTNARLVLRNEVVEGSLSLRGGKIAEISSSLSNAPSAIDCEGDLLLPGLIEMHTDNVEKHIAPRPAVIWPTIPAVLDHDAQVAAAGITTVYDALSVGEYSQGTQRRKMLGMAMDAIHEAKRQNLFRIEHRLHMRLELADDAVLDIFAPYADSDLVGLASFMDHTPGQRQWSDVDVYRNYYRTKHGWSDEAIEKRIAEATEAQARNSAKNRAELLNMCRARGLAMASHDDATTAHIDEAVADGITISEFPTTIEAARHARAKGMSIVMGAPNVVRNGSHSGNVSATELAQHDLLDVLSSDYVPSSLLLAAFCLRDRLGWDLPRAIGVISANPAGMLGLYDRGVIEAGKRADLIRVAETGHGPIVRCTWAEGRRVA